MQIAPQTVLSQSDNPGEDKHLEKFAHRLAKMHDAHVVPVPAQGGQQLSRLKKTDLLEYLQSWEQALRNANAIFKAAPSKDLAAARAGEWMLDNFYFIKQTLRQIEEDLPASFLTELPKLNGTPLQGHPRIFALA